MRDYWIGFDLGGTKMQANVLDANLATVARERKKTKGYEGVDRGLARMERTIASAIAAAGIATDRIAGIGIGSPGPLELDRGVILNTPNLGWKNVPLKKHLEKVFGCPAVVLNDVDAGVYGEFQLGAARRARCVVGIFPGTGIGGGCVYEGSLVRGARQSIMEIGHMPVLRGGPLCGCGRRGCLEAVASRLVISAAVAAAAYRGDAPYILAKAGTDLANIRSGMLADAIAAGDAVVERVVREAARWCGFALGGVVNLMGPDVILLGGGLVAAMPNIFTKEVGAGIAEQVMPAFEGTYKIVTAKLGDDATALGAGAWARWRVAGGGNDAP